MTDVVEITEAIDMLTLDAAYDPAAIVVGQLNKLRRQLDTHLAAQSDDVVRRGPLLIKLTVAQHVAPRKTPS